MTNRAVSKEQSLQASSRMVKLWRPDSWFILVTDDDSPTRTTVADALTTSGYQIRLASTATESFEIARHEYLHLAILDHNLPDLTGLEAARLLRQITGRPMPCILMSGERLEAKLLESVALEVWQFMPKPVDLGFLRRAVHDALVKHYVPDSRSEGGQ